MKRHNDLKQYFFSCTCLRCIKVFHCGQAIFYCLPRKLRHNTISSIRCYLAITFLSILQDSEEDALLEGYICKDTKCDGILLPDSGWLPVIRKILSRNGTTKVCIKETCQQYVLKQLIFNSVSIDHTLYLCSTSLGKKAYTCRKCGIYRDGEEVKKVSREILLLSDKASSLLSSGSILFTIKLLTITDYYLIGLRIFCYLNELYR